jgi:hypothetical protein
MVVSPGRSADCKFPGREDGNSPVALDGEQGRRHAFAQSLPQRMPGEQSRRRRTRQRVPGAGDVGNGAWCRRGEPEGPASVIGDDGVVSRRHHGRIQADGAQACDDSRCWRIFPQPRQCMDLAPVEEGERQPLQHGFQPHHLGRRDGDGEDRPGRLEPGQPLQRRRRQVGVDQQRIRLADGLAQAGTAHLLREGEIIERHVGEPDHKVALGIEDSGIARRRPVEEDGGKIGYAGLSDRPRHRLAGRVAAAHRHQRRRKAAPDGRADGIEDAAADILAHHARVGSRRHVGAADLAAPVDMRTADGENVWLGVHAPDPVRSNRSPLDWRRASAAPVDRFSVPSLKQKKNMCGI